MSLRCHLKPLFDDVPRLGDGVYMTEFVPLYVQNLLSIVKQHLSLECVVDLFRRELVSWGRLQTMSRGNSEQLQECCCAVTPPMQYQSINCGRRMCSFTGNHKAIIEAIMGVFGVSYRECSGIGSSWSRVYDLRGTRIGLTAFVPVFDFVLGGYELVMFMQLRSLRCSKKKKMEVRAAATRAFVAALQEECLNYQEGRL